MTRPWTVLLVAAVLGLVWADALFVRQVRRQEAVLQVAMTTVHAQARALAAREDALVDQRQRLRALQAVCPERWPLAWRRTAGEEAP